MVNMIIKEAMNIGHSLVYSAIDGVVIALNLIYIMNISKALRRLIKNISFPKILIQREREGFTFFIENLLHAYIVF